jgi:sulfite dehydrogenase
LRAFALVLASGLLALSGNSHGADASAVARGKTLFSTVSPACATCHTLQAAQAQGQIGPVLDEIKPSAPRVLRALRAGLGVMPSYAQRLSEEDMRALASFVSDATGGGTQD